MRKSRPTHLLNTGETKAQSNQPSESVSTNRSGRRHFLKNAALLTPVLAINPTYLTASNTSRIRTGFIGAGQWGRQYHPALAAANMLGLQTGNRYTSLSATELQQEYVISKKHPGTGQSHQVLKKGMVNTIRKQLQCILQPPTASSGLWRSFLRNRAVR